MGPVRVAIVDDSAFIRKALGRLFEGEPRVRVVGAASSGEELCEHLNEWRPDVVTLDLSMPGMGGLATLERVREWRNVPVIVLSTHSSKDAPQTIEALHRGAVDFIDKQQYSLVDFQTLRRVLLDKVLSVTGTAGQVREFDAPSCSVAVPPPVEAQRSESGQRFDLAVIGASTGGPPAIQKVLEEMGGVPPVPIVVVQHMPLGFTKAFATRLNAHLAMPVREASHNEALVPGTAYIAPSGLHLRLKRENGIFYAVLARFPEKVQHRPSVDVLFNSAVSFCPRVLSVLLTGMGRDGAEGMMALRRNGAVTIGQSESSCVVYGMPKAAMELGGVMEQLDLQLIGPRMSALLEMGP